MTPHAAAARALTEEEVLCAAEFVTTWAPWARPLAILRVAAPEVPWAALTALPLGLRERRVLEVYARTFGPSLDGLARCPACGERAALSLDAGDLLAEPAPTEGEFLVDVSGRSLRCRLVCTADLAAASREPSLTAARQRIARRCVLAVDGAAPDAPLPDATVDALSPELQARDPLADVSIRTACPACGHAWTTAFDVAVITAAALVARATRVMDDVNALARAYGWTERDVLTLSPWRRRAYLERIGR